MAIFLSFYRNVSSFLGFLISTQMAEWTKFFRFLLTFHNCIDDIYSNMHKYIIVNVLLLCTFLLMQNHFSFVPTNSQLIQLQEFRFKRGKNCKKDTIIGFVRPTFHWNALNGGEGGLSNSSGMSVCHEQQFINRNNFDQCQSIRFDRYQTYQIELLRFIDV